uniref:Protein kinase domain-containing protein n=1 Tax=Panagrellus redivivus TaxID=6233 RepID=A0A7E4W800_PANRE
MAGGSLYDYIQDDNTPLKYQDTFDYMDQILSAMVYLSEQQIVHRDLAARNCLLEAWVRLRPQPRISDRRGRNQHNPHRRDASGRTAWELPATTKDRHT